MTCLVLPSWSPQARSQTVLTETCAFHIIEWVLNSIFKRVVGDYHIICATFHIYTYIIHITYAFESIYHLSIYLSIISLSIYLSSFFAYLFFGGDGDGSVNEIHSVQALRTWFGPKPHMHQE